MKLTALNKATAIVMEILRYAEISGLEPKLCGAIFESVNGHLTEMTESEGDEDKMKELIEQILRIIVSLEIEDLRFFKLEGCPGGSIEERWGISTDP